MLKGERYTPTEPEEEPSREEKEEEAELGVEDIRSMREKLEAEIEAAKAQKEELVEKQVSERESLIAEAKRINELLPEARGTLEYFAEMEALGQLKGKKELADFEKIKKLVASLEKQEAGVSEKIDKISEKPEVPEKLRDAAERERKEREYKKIIEQAQERLNPQIESLAIAIEDTAVKMTNLYKKIEEQRNRTDRPHSFIAELFERVRLQKSAKKKPHLIDDLRQIFYKSASGKEMRERLEESREGLGIFQRKEKAILDYVLKQGSSNFEDLDDQLAKLSELEEELSTTENKIEDFVEKYSDIMTEAWGEEDKLTEFSAHFSVIPSMLSSRLSKRMESIADVKHYEKGKKEKVGKYEDWFEANKDPKNDSLYRIWQRTEKESKISPFSRPEKIEEAEG